MEPIKSIGPWNGHVAIQDVGIGSEDMENHPYMKPTFEIILHITLFLGEHCNSLNLDVLL